MKYRIFAVRDGKVEQFFPPMCFQNAGEAERWLSDVCNDGKSAIWKHPADYALYELGTYDSENGALASITPVLTCAAIDVFAVQDIREVKHG